MRESDAWLNSLTGSTETFTWTAGSGASGLRVDIGSVPGGNQYYQSGTWGVARRPRQLNGLPTNGSTVYADAVLLRCAQWLANSYTYTAFNLTSGLGVLQTPTPGSTPSGNQATFTWSAGTGATAYWMDIGTTVGGNDVYQSGNLGNVLTTTTDLPANGSQIDVTLYSYVGGQWLSNAYTYVSRVRKNEQG